MEDLYESAQPKALLTIGCVHWTSGLPDLIPRLASVMVFEMSLRLPMFVFARDWTRLQGPRDL
jgi:hypothetical protein